MTAADWRRQIQAVLRKEFRTEIRSPHGLLTGLLFAVLAVVAMMMATLNQRISATVSAGLMYVILLFSAVSALPRSFIGEEEAGTGDLLRLTADPHAVFWGKALYNALLTLVTAVVLTVLFVLFMHQTVASVGLLAASLFGGGLALSGAVTLCGALAARASGRHALAGAIALPLVIPVAIWGVASLRVAFGEGVPLTWNDGRAAAFDLIAYAVVSNAVGPYIYAQLWKR